jgi:tetratricopeptide (TPR) repeat protein
MKINRIGYLSVLLLSLWFVGCNSKKGSQEAETNPVFQSTPDLKDVTERISKTPEDAALYFERGNVLHKLRFDSLALKDYKKAAKLDSTKGQYFSAVGDLMFENHDITGSIEWLQKAIAKNPTDRKAHLKIAKLFLYMQDYGKAFAEINIVLRKNVYDPEAYFLKGMVYKDMKDTAKALSAFQTAAQVAPDYRDAVIQLGLIYSDKKDPIALQYLEKAFRMDTTDVFPIFAKGTYYQNQNKFAEAKEQYRQCVIRNRHYADAYFNLGYLLMQEDSVAKAYRQYDFVTKVDPMNPAAYFNRGLCAEMMDSMQKAVADYRTALRIDSAYDSPREALKRLKGK